MAASGVRSVCGGLLHAILRLSLFNGLPLHVCRGIQPAALQGDYVVDDVAGTIDKEHNPRQSRPLREQQQKVLLEIC